MANKGLCIGTAATALAVGVAIGHRIFYKKGYETGAREKVDEVLTEYVVYYTPDELIDLVYGIKEDEGDSTQFPVLVIRPDKYDYIDGYGINAGF